MSISSRGDPDRAVERPRFSGYPFTLGVASGAPLPDGVVLWTRLAPRPVSGGGAGRDPVLVRWQVADDERFARIVRRGSVTARPSGAFSVHVEVDGLQPARWYGAHRHLAAEDLDLMGFVGDYIYEGAGGAGDVRRHVGGETRI